MPFLSSEADFHVGYTGIGGLKWNDGLLWLNLIVCSALSLEPSASRESGARHWPSRDDIIALPLVTFKYEKSRANQENGLHRF